MPDADNHLNALLKAIILAAAWQQYRQAADIACLGNSKRKLAAMEATFKTWQATKALIR